MSTPAQPPIPPAPPHVAPDRRLQAGKVAIWTVRILGDLLLAYIAFVQIILALGFFLLLFGANPSAGFVDFVYRSLDRVMAPFRGIFEPVPIGTGANDVEAVFDTSILFAMIIYGLVFLGLRAVLRWLGERLTRLEAHQDQAAYDRAVERAAADLVAAERAAAAAAAQAAAQRQPSPQTVAYPQPPPPPTAGDESTRS